MRLMVMGESLAFARASLKVFCLMLRFTWGFITTLAILGSLIMVWKQEGTHKSWLSECTRGKASWAEATDHYSNALLLKYKVHLDIFMTLKMNYQQYFPHHFVIKCWWKHHFLHSLTCNSGSYFWLTDTFPSSCSTWSSLFCLLAAENRAVA